MSDVIGLIGAIGIALGGLSGVAAIIGVWRRRRHRPQPTVAGAVAATPAVPGAVVVAPAQGNNSALRMMTDAAAMLAFAAFVAALIVNLYGLRSHTPLPQGLRLGAVIGGILAGLAGSVLVLRRHGSDKNTAQTGGLALLTGVAVLLGMLVVA